MPAMRETSHEISATNVTLPSIPTSLQSLLDSDGALHFKGRRHLIDVEALSASEIEAIIEIARSLKTLMNQGQLPLRALSGKSVATLFYENSTRTRSSFELAAANLDAHVLNLDINSSSVAKGETIDDTARTISAMGVSALIQRHAQSGSPERLEEVAPPTISIINAGDGWRGHPTQALLDYMTMIEICRSVEGKKIVIIGDIKHSRVARSNISLLKKFGADIHVCGPPPLVPYGIESLGVSTHDDLCTAVEGADFIMALRLQKERQKQGLIPSTADYAHLYRVDHACLKIARPGVRILHPGPINRGIEITGALADDQNLSLITTQVTNGIAVRMAVLLILLRNGD